MKRVNFKQKWGISCNELAKREGVTPEAIRMRVRNYGTPFQRRCKLTNFEKKYGKTLGDIALELNLHPQTVARRDRIYGDAYAETKFRRPTLRGQILNERGEHWTVNSKMGFIRCDSTYMEEYDENKKV